MKKLLTPSILAAMIVVLQPTAHAKSPKLRDAVVVAIGKLPPASQRPAQAIFLHTSKCDSTYLYIEQNQGKDLVVLDVADPSRIRLKAEAKLDAPAPFDFRQRIGADAVLIRYRDGSGFGILDLTKPKKPALTAISAPASETYIEPASILEGGLHSPVTLTDTEDYKVVDKKHEEVLATVKAVQQLLTDYASGATYLLGQDGLTVIRNPRIESSILPCVVYDDGPNG